MTLVVHVTVNSAVEVATVAIHRTVNVGTWPDAQNGYTWTVVQADGKSWCSQFPLMHRYGDGGVVLLAKVMQAWEASR